MSWLPAWESFVRVVEGGSMAAAARTLGCTRAQVSKQVAELERRLGAALFERSTRRLVLTPAPGAGAELSARYAHDARIVVAPEREPARRASSLPAGGAGWAGFWAMAGGAGGTWGRASVATDGRAVFPCPLLATSRMASSSGVGWGRRDRVSKAFWAIFSMTT